MDYGARIAAAIDDYIATTRGITKQSRAHLASIAQRMRSDKESHEFATGMVDLLLHVERTCPEEDILNKSMEILEKRKELLDARAEAGVAGLPFFSPEPTAHEPYFPTPRARRHAREYPRRCGTGCCG